MVFEDRMDEDISREMKQQLKMICMCVCLSQIQSLAAFLRENQSRLRESHLDVRKVACAKEEAVQSLFPCDPGKYDLNLTCT